MVFDLDGQPLVTGNEAWATRHGPALHDTVELEPKIIVESPCGVLLNDKSMAALARDFAFRFGRDAEAALCPICL